MSLIPQPSLHLVVRKKVKVAVMETGKNDSVLLHLLPGPGAAAVHNPS